MIIKSRKTFPSFITNTGLICMIVQQSEFMVKLQNIPLFGSLTEAKHNNWFREEGIILRMIQTSFYEGGYLSEHVEYAKVHWWPYLNQYYDAHTKEGNPNWFQISVLGCHGG